MQRILVAAFTIKYGDAYNLIKMNLQPVNTREVARNNERVLLYVLLASAVINIILMYIAGETNTQYPGRDYGRSLWVKILVIHAAIIISGFLSGLFVGLLPYKKLPYKHKYILSSLLSMLVLSLLLFIFIIRSILLFS